MKPRIPHNDLRSAGLRPGHPAPSKINMPLIIAQEHPNLHASKLSQPKSIPIPPAKKTKSTAIPPEG